MKDERNPLRECTRVTMPQSEIKTMTGFSRTKTSFILKSLQDKGCIWKEKWAREFFVHLKDDRVKKKVRVHV